MKSSIRKIAGRTRKLFSCLVCLSFILNTLTPPAMLYAQSAPTYLNLPLPGTMVTPTPGFIPVMVKGLTVDPQNPLHFNFIVDTGHTDLQGEELRAESTKLIKYFLASLTVPENELWVNLSPYEKDRIIAENFGVTEMGRDLLAQDYLLKQLTASLIHPDKELGKEFWSRVREKAYRSFGTTEIPMNTFNKVWIIPDRALVYENEGTAFIVESHLKVMLDEDYVALDQAAVQNKTQDAPPTQMSSLQSQILKDIVVPEIEKEVNEGKTFANLRQIYHSLILAAWYKVTLKNSLLGQVYVDQNKVRGVDIEDKTAKEKIYQQYLEAFRKGVYDFIKEDYDPVSQEMIPRKYFSGGFSTTDKDGAQLAQVVQRDLIKGDVGQYPAAVQQRIAQAAQPVGNFAMIAWTAVETTEGDRTSADLSADEAMVTNGLTLSEPEQWARERIKIVRTKGVQPEHMAEILQIAEKDLSPTSERLRTIKARAELYRTADVQPLGDPYFSAELQEKVKRLQMLEAYWTVTDLTKSRLMPQGTNPLYRNLTQLRMLISEISQLPILELMTSEHAYLLRRVNMSDLHDGDLFIWRRGFFQENAPQKDPDIMFVYPLTEHTERYKMALADKQVVLVAASRATRLKLGLPDAAMIGTAVRVRAAMDRAAQLLDKVNGNRSVPLSFAITEMLPYKSEAAPRLAGLIYLFEHDRPLFEKIVRKIIVRSIDKDLSKNKLLTDTFSLVQTDGHLGHRVRDLFWSALVPNNRVDAKIFADRVLPLAERYKRNAPLTEEEEEDLQYLLRNIGGFFSPTDTAVLGLSDMPKRIFTGLSPDDLASPNRIHIMLGVVDLTQRRVGAEEDNSIATPAIVDTHVPGEKDLIQITWRRTTTIAELEEALRNSDLSIDEAVVSDALRGHDEAMMTGEAVLKIISVLKGEEPGKLLSDLNYLGSLQAKLNQQLEGSSVFIDVVPAQIVPVSMNLRALQISVNGNATVQDWRDYLRESIRHGDEVIQSRVLGLPQLRAIERNVEQADPQTLRADIKRLKNSNEAIREMRRRGVLGSTYDELISTHLQVIDIIAGKLGENDTSIFGKFVALPSTELRDFVPSLLGKFGISKVKSIEVATLRSQSRYEAIDVIRDQDVTEAINISVNQALGSILFAGQAVGKTDDEAKKLGTIFDANSVWMGHWALLEAVETNPDVAFASIASEGINDGSVGTPVGRIYWNGYEGFYRNSAGQADFEAQINMLRHKGIQIINFLDDALENTNSLKSGKKDAWSVTAFHFDKGSGSARHLLEEDKIRRLSVVANAPKDAGLDPLDSPKQVLVKLARANGIEDIDSAEGLVFAKRVIMGILGERPEGYEKASGNKRHDDYIEEIRQLERQYGVRARIVPDGDAMMGLLAATGIPLDDQGSFMVKFGRSGLVEGEVMELTMSEISGQPMVDGVQIGSRVVSNEKTKDRVTPETAVQVEEGLLEKLMAEKGYHADTFTSDRRQGRSGLEGKAVIVMTAVTGADEERYGPAFAQMMEGITFDELTNTISVNSFVVAPEGVYIVRTQLEAPDMAAAKNLILRASPQSTEYLASLGDAAMAGIVLRELEDELREEFGDAPAASVTFNDEPLSIAGRSEQDLAARIAGALVDAGVGPTAPLTYGLDFENEPVGVDIWTADEAMAAKFNSAQVTQLKALIADGLYRTEIGQSGRNGDSDDMDAIARQLLRALFDTRAGQYSGYVHLIARALIDEDLEQLNDLIETDEAMFARNREGQMRRVWDPKATASQSKKLYTDQLALTRARDAKNGQAPKSPVKKTNGDAAMAAEVGRNDVGGIDLNPALLNLQIKRDGNGVPLPVEMQPIQQMHIDGFVPVIINIVPLNNVPMLLGIADQIPGEPMKRAEDRETQKIPAISQSKFTVREDLI